MTAPDSIAAAVGVRNPARLLKGPEVAERLTVGERTLARFVKEGRFPQPIRVGRGVRWTEKTVEDWLAAREAESETRNG